MTDERKKPLWQWIAALLIGLPVLYAASFGPACWAVSWTGLGSRALSVAYKPIIERMRRGAWRPFDDAFSGAAVARSYPEHWMAKYARLCARDGWNWRCVAVYDTVTLNQIGQGECEWCHKGEPSRFETITEIKIDSGP